MADRDRFIPRRDEFLAIKFQTKDARNNTNMDPRQAALLEEWLGSTALKYSPKKSKDNASFYHQRNRRDADSSLFSYTSPSRSSHSKKYVYVSPKQSNINNHSFNSKNRRSPYKSPQKASSFVSSSRNPLWGERSIVNTGKNENKKKDKGAVIPLRAPRTITSSKSSDGLNNSEKDAEFDLSLDFLSSDSTDCHLTTASCASASSSSSSSSLSSSSSSFASIRSPLPPSSPAQHSTLFFSVICPSI
eukprot:TRINITY_DN865_c0_g2_i2.p1 TRINITY_DN865_c0_g2~~TRINITY_DN865_c0_g2_i2.p1  ORF type:complete len:267 (+),score=75.24 TRINITY_DN865_c0_g2_i2:64-801(+)